MNKSKKNALSEARYSSINLSDVDKQRGSATDSGDSYNTQKNENHIRDEQGRFVSKEYIAGSGGLKAFKQLKLQRVIPVFIVVSLVGGFFVYRSFAASTIAAIPDCVTGTVNKGVDQGAYNEGQRFAVRLCAIPGFKSTDSEDGGTVRVSSVVAGKWLSLFNTAKKNGITLSASSSYRSMAKQQYFWNCYTNPKVNCNNRRVASRPGYSNHQAGKAVDIDIVANQNDPSLTACRSNPSKYPIYKWLISNAWWSGLTAQVASECWHWSPGGR